MTVSKILDQPKSDVAHLRLYTHNVWGRYGDWEKRRKALINEIRELNPDLITLQETIVTTEYDQVSELLGDAYHIAHSRERASDGTGASIASRWLITDVHESDQNVTPRAGSYPCSTMVAEIETPEPFGTLLLVNHFPEPHVDHEHERELQTVVVARHIEERIVQRPAHVILAGDLNAQPDAASLRFLAGQQSLDGLSVCYRNAWDAVHPGEPGGTFVVSNPLVPGDWPFERIDHIFVRCGEHGGPTFRIAGCELAFNEPIGGVWASDHFGLVADFTALDTNTA